MTGKVRETKVDSKVQSTLPSLVDAQKCAMSHGLSVDSQQAATGTANWLPRRDKGRKRFSDAPQSARDLVLVRELHTQVQRCPGCSSDVRHLDALQARQIRSIALGSLSEKHSGVGERLNFIAWCRHAPRPPEASRACGEGKAQRISALRAPPRRIRNSTCTAQESYPRAALAWRKRGARAPASAGRSRLGVLLRMETATRALTSSLRPRP